jgi:hypothetical protein
MKKWFEKTVLMYLLIFVFIRISISLNYFPMKITGFKEINILFLLSIIFIYLKNIKNQFYLKYLKTALY